MVGKESLRLRKKRSCCSNVSIESKQYKPIEVSTLQLYYRIVKHKYKVQLPSSSSPSSYVTSA